MAKLIFTAEYLVELAWGVIANVNQGNWRIQRDEWQRAAERWRDNYHAYLEQNKQTGTSEIKAEKLIDSVADALRTEIVQRLQGLVDKWQDAQTCEPDIVACRAYAVCRGQLKTLISELQPQPKFKRGELLHHKPTGVIGIVLSCGDKYTWITNSTIDHKNAINYTMLTDDLERVDSERTIVVALEQRSAETSDSQA